MKSKESGRKFQKEVCAGYYAVVLLFVAQKLCLPWQILKETFHDFQALS